MVQLELYQQHNKYKMSCNICGSHDLRCNCEVTQPFCDQCAEDDTCGAKMDAQCVIYHFNSTTPSQLTCLGLGNNVSVQEIFEAIDDLICSNFNIPFEPIDSPSIEWTASGPAGHKPTADVILSPDAGQIIVERANGLFAENEYKVKVDATDTPDFLVNQIEGVLSPTGVSIEVDNIGGVLKIRASIDLETFGPLLCQFCSSSSPSGGVGCDGIEVFGTFELGTPSNGLLQIPITVLGSGQLSVTATVNNSSFFGSITQSVSTGVTFISLPIFYNGLGSDGIQNIIISFTGTSNVISCDVDVTVDPGVVCVPVSIIGTPVLPDAYVDVAYNYTISLNGTQPFALSSIIKPTWMTIAVVGGDIIFSGTPAIGDAGTGISVSFTIENCVSDTAPFSDTIDVIPYSIELIGSCTPGIINSSYLISGFNASDVAIVRATFSGLIQKVGGLFTRANLSISSPNGTSDADVSGCFTDTNPHGFSLQADTVITLTGTTAIVNLDAVVHNSSESITNVSVSIIDVNGNPYTITVGGCKGNSGTGGGC